MSLQGSSSINPAGGEDVNVSLTKQFGSSDHYINGDVFAAGNTKTGEAVYGASAACNVNGHGLSVSKTITPNADITSKAAHVNLFTNETHQIDAILQREHIKLDNGFNYNKYGGSVDYNHEAGHAASVGITNIPKFDNKSVHVMGKANLWTSPTGNTSFDATAAASRTISGPHRGQHNIRGGLRLNHRF